MSDGILWLLFADACMAGVILSVQLLVYPGFSYFTGPELVRWHRRYTRNISLIVVPLMTIQLLGGFYWLFSRPGLPPGVYTFLICLLWGITFGTFVPLHRRISDGVAQKRDLSLLVSKNWIRTAFWLLLFAWHLGSYAGWVPH
ncbi:MAG: hypothetical protein P8Z38_00990 [Robiginitalea sp.]